MYSRPIKVYQGIDNPIQMIVRNQDQKAVDLTGYSVQVDIQDPTNRLVVASYVLQFDQPGGNQTQGNGTFTIPAAVLNGLEQRFYQLVTRTIRIVDNAQQPLYMDDNYSVPLDLEVLPGYLAS